ncbi:MAG: SPOR domain-containing protein [Exilispira sp.]
MNIKFKKEIFVIIFLIFLFILNFPNTLKTETSEENEFKIFLNQVILNSPQAKDSGYNFIKKYPNSNYVADVLYYLTFVEQDYFQNIINLKKVILYYPVSIWRESSIVRLLNIYLLKGNFIQFEQWYNYYLDNFSIKNKNWEVEILNLKSLWKQNKTDLLFNVIEKHLKDAKNYQLLSYCVFLKGILLKEKNLSMAKKEFLIGISMFEESNYFDSLIYELYKLSFREEKAYYAKILINKKIFSTINDDEKREIKQLSQINTNFKPVKLIDERLIRDYYYILLGYSSDKKNIEDIKNNLEKIGIKVSLKSINDNIFQIFIGFFHFKSDAQNVLLKLAQNGYTGQLNFIDYSY